MGEVCRAKDTELDRDVAIKIQPGASLSGPSGFGDFLPRLAKIAPVHLSLPMVLVLVDLDPVAYASAAGSSAQARLTSATTPAVRRVHVLRHCTLAGCSAVSVSVRLSGSGIESVTEKLKLEGSPWYLTRHAT